jgi:hypothetical protein
VISGIVLVQRKLAELQNKKYVEASNARLKNEQDTVKQIGKANEKLATSKDKNAKKEIAANNQLANLSRARIAEESAQQTKAYAEMQKSNLNFINDWGGKKREQATISQQVAEQQIAAAQQAQNKIISGLDEEAGKRYDNFKEAAKLQKDLNEEAANVPNVFGESGGGGGGGGGGKSEVEKELEEKQKELEEAEKERLESVKDAVDEYTESIEKTGDATEQLAKDSEDYYDDIARAIEGAKEKQAELRKELEDFTLEENDQFLRDAAERQVELAEEEQKVKDEINEVQNQQLETEEDKIRQQEKINELNEELNAILAERKEIEEFTKVPEGGNTAAADKFAQELLRAQERGAASEFGLAKLDLEEKLKAKQEEIQAEIDKQQKILDIQQQFYDLQNAQGEEAEAKKQQLNALVENQRDLTPEERKQQLLDLGFSELDAEGQIELLKQAERFKALEVEKNQIEEQQKDILETKEEYFKLAEETHAESVDEMISQTDALIARINDAIQAQLRLRELGGSGGGGASGSTTSVNITNNNASGIDVQNAIQNALNGINQ